MYPRCHLIYRPKAIPLALQALSHDKSFRTDAAVTASLLGFPVQVAARKCFSFGRPARLSPAPALLEDVPRSTPLRHCLSMIIAYENPDVNEICINFIYRIYKFSRRKNPHGEVLRAIFPAHASLCGKHRNGKSSVAARPRAEAAAHLPSAHNAYR